MFNQNKKLSEAAISELRRLFLFLDTDLEDAARMSMEEIERDLHTMGMDPDRPIPERIRLLLTRPTHVFVRNDTIKDECSDEVKLLILKIRELGAQQRYEEALDLALKATRIDPNCWRAKTSLGVLLVALEQVDDGDKIFAQVLRDFPNTKKALATELHASAWVAETRCKLRPEAKVLQKISRMYEQALSLDPSAANTRASLFICHAKSGETEKQNQLVKESVMIEGFFDALRFELNVRGTTARKALLGLSTELRNLLYPIDPVAVESHALPMG